MPVPRCQRCPLPHRAEPPVPAAWRCTKVEVTPAGRMVTTTNLCDEHRWEEFHGEVLNGGRHVSGCAVPITT